MTTDVQNPSWGNVGPTKPPVTEIGVLGWLRHNLFSSVGNSLLTLITLVLLYFGVTSFVRWLITGFWVPIWENRKLFATGPYPNEQIVQPLIVLLMVALLFGLSAGRWGSLLRDLGAGLAALLLVLALLPLGARVQIGLGLALFLLVAGYFVGARLRVSSRLLVILWIASLPLSFIILGSGMQIPFTPIGIYFAAPVQTNLWGGLMLTLLLTVVGIACSFPLGVLLALGRRSSLPVVRYFCIAYIELIRGSPLIALLFMGMVLLPLFLPASTPAPASLTRVAVAITLFSAAYLAETVRGGLQSIPKGQYEAADALGLGVVSKLRLIILPQALTKVIPALVGQFISLFKDTSLVSLLGLLDLLGVAKSVVQQPMWMGVAGGVTKEVYLFVALVYFVFSYGMSVASKRIEHDLRAGQQ